MTCTEEELLWLFTEVHGVISRPCRTGFIYDGEDNLRAVAVIKDGDICWTARKEDLLVSYLYKQHRSNP